MHATTVLYFKICEVIVYKHVHMNSVMFGFQFQCDLCYKNCADLKSNAVLCIVGLELPSVKFHN